jgi:hypothetical protein
MMKKTLKMLSILGAASFVGAGSASAVDVGCPNALFTARGCETQRISIGGFIAANYQWVDVNDDLIGPNNSNIVVNDVRGRNFGAHKDPEEFNNFYMKNIRLFIRAELCDNWTGFMSVDFAGNDRRFLAFDPNAGVKGATFIDSSFECRNRSPIFIDRAYIEKRWCSATLRAGYQKVYFGAEEVIPDEYLKTVERSVATNFFMSLGDRVVGRSIVDLVTPVPGAYTPGERVFVYGGNRFADRHVGLYLSGDACGNNFHYNLAIVNGYQGLCRNSTQFNNRLGYFAGLGYESCCCDVDVLIGLNAGYKQKGGDWSTDLCPPNNTNDYHVWGLNPYILANWNCFSLLAEMLYGSVQNAQLTNLEADANPWGFNLIPSYMINDCWEIVGRLSYLNTNKMGTSIQNAFGAAPDSGDVQPVGTVGCATRNNTFIASEAQFEKVTALYVGVNYYTVNQAVKATLGYEWARFKGAFFGNTGNFGPTTTNIGSFNDQKAVVQAVRAQLQLLF